MAEVDLDAKLNEYIEKSQEAYLRGIEVMQDLTGWTKLKENNGVIGYTMPNTDTNFNSLKVEMFIDKPPKDCARYVYDNFGALNKEFEADDMEQFEMVKEINENVRLFNVKIYPKGPVSSRFLTTCGVFLDLGNDTYVQVGTSVDQTWFGVETPEGCVHGHLTMAVYVWEPIAGDASKTHFNSCTLINPKGDIPAMVANAILGNRTTMFEKIKARLEEVL